MKKLFGHSSSKGMTILEIIIVIVLMAGMMLYALPNINSSNDYITKVNIFAASVKSAFDTAVLTGKPYRIAIEFSTGDYWLESTLEQDYKISSTRSGRDLNEEQSKAYREEFDADFEEYVELAGSTISDMDSGDEIKPESPVVRAKKKLMDPTWFRVDSIEWTKKNIGPDLGFAIIQAEHHLDPINGIEDEEGTVAHIYVSPTGYVEKAYVVIVPIDSDGRLIEEEEPFTIETVPFEGMATVTEGKKEFNFERLD